MDKNNAASTRPGRWLASVLAAATVLSACGGGGGGGGNVGGSTETAATAGTTTTANSGAASALSKKRPGTVPPSPNTEGRLLASNCFQCHGTQGAGGFESIRGKEASEVLEYLNKPASNDIMAAHAQGYTPAQLQKIITHLQQ